MWNEGLRQVDKSQTLLLNEQSRAREKEGREVFKFGFGQSPFPPIEAACEALRAHAAAKDYTAVQGLPELRERVAAFHGTVDGIEADAGRVLVGPGSKALLYAVMRAYRRADVLVPVPAWVSYRPQALLAGHACLPVHTSFEQAWHCYRREMIWGFIIWLLNSSDYQTEANNTAAAARFATAMIDHDTFGILGV